MIISWGPTVEYWLITSAVAVGLTVNSIRRALRPGPDRGLFVLGALLEPFFGYWGPFLTGGHVDQSPALTASSALVACWFAAVIGTPFFMGYGYSALWRMFAWKRGERLCMPEEEGKAYTALVKARSIAKFVRVTENELQFGGVREHYQNFMTAVAQIRALGYEKTSPLGLPQDLVDLLFLDTFNHESWQEWAIVLCGQYTIGGEGFGPQLTLGQLVEQAEEEERRPQVDKTALPGTLARRWRCAAFAMSMIWLPFLVLGGFTQATVLNYQPAPSV